MGVRAVACYSWSITVTVLQPDRLPMGKEGCVDERDSRAMLLAQMSLRGPGT